ncbi:hypothetical protein [Streptomyces sp. NPDC056982]|uniref:hypothetical protein n=1 Tax=Streptomyces sp. NPDC056982 TaxID=3345986 RepID=UPI00362F2557
MSVMTVEERGDLAEAMLPKAANLVALVHGDGGPEDVQQVLTGLDATQKDALLIVLAGLVDPDQPISKALGWLEFTEDRDLAVPPWNAKQRVRDLAPEPQLDDDDLDPVAVHRYANGFGVEVTTEERLAAIRQCVANGLSYAEVDALRDLPKRSTENFVNRTKKRYIREGLAWTDMPKASQPEFTDEQVRQIRERYAQGGLTDLALSLTWNVSRKTMSSLLTGDSYRSAGGPIRAKRTTVPTASREAMCGHGSNSQAAHLNYAA